MVDFTGFVTLSEPTMAIGGWLPMVLAQQASPYHSGVGCIRGVDHPTSDTHPGLSP